MKKMLGKKKKKKKKGEENLSLAYSWPFFSLAHYWPNLLFVVMLQNPNLSLISFGP